jgi:SHS family lactate transporter-like MFS transporter
MIDVVFYSVVEVLSGLAPDYQTFLWLRALYGIGMGGEWGVGASLAMEAVPAQRRGLLSGLLQEGYAVGYLLAAAAYFFVFPAFGWRALFFLGGAPALLALYIRRQVPESPTWQRARPDTRRIVQAVIENRGRFLYLIALMTMLNLMSHGTQDIYPTFLEKERGLPARMVATIAIVYNVGALCGGLLFGGLSDRLGRRRAMVAAALCGFAAIPFWIFAASPWELAAGAFAMQFMVQGAWGVVPAHLTELSPAQVRGLFPGLAYQLGVLLASGAPYFEARDSQRTSATPTRSAWSPRSSSSAPRSSSPSAASERRWTSAGRKDSEVGGGVSRWHTRAFATSCETRWPSSPSAGRTRSTRSRTR